MVYKPCFMVPCLEFGSIKWRCLKPTKKKQFPSSICAVYWLLYRQRKQPLRYLNKNRPVFFSQLILYCQAGLQLEAGDMPLVLCLHCWHCSDLVFLLQITVSVPFLAQLCHLFLSSRNTISDLTSSLWSAKLHVFFCAGQNDSTS